MDPFDLGLLNDVKTELGVVAVSGTLFFILRRHNNHLDELEAEYERQQAQEAGVDYKKTQ